MASDDVKERPWACRIAPHMFDEFANRRDIVRKPQRHRPRKHLEVVTAIPNSRANCYFTSVVQALLSIRVIATLIEHATHTCKDRACILCALRRSANEKRKKPRIK